MVQMEANVHVLFQTLKPLLRLPLSFTGWSFFYHYKNAYNLTTDRVSQLKEAGKSTDDIESITVRTQEAAVRFSSMSILRL